MLNLPKIEDCLFKSKNLDFEDVGAIILCKREFKYCKVAKYNYNLTMFELQCLDCDCRCFSRRDTHIYKPQ